MRIFTYLIMLIVILVGVSFAVLNAQTVAVNLYFTTSKLPLSLLLAFTMVLGVFLGLLVSLILYIRLKSANYRLKRRLKLAEAEVSNLRAIPLKNEH